MQAKNVVSITRPLSLEYIDEAAELIINYGKDNKLDKRLITRVRLSVEESLTIWCKHATNEDEFTLVLESTFNGHLLKVESTGENIDPYTAKLNDESFGASNRLLIELGLVPEYFRRANLNVLVFKLKRKPMNPIKKILLVLLSSIVIGLLMINLLPNDFITAFNEDFLTPIYQAFFRVLGSAAGPMIFLSVAWGVYGIGDAVTLGRIGKKMFIYFMVLNSVVALSMLVLLPIFKTTFVTSTNQSSGFGAIFAMLLNIIPSSIIEPFADGNTLQIIYLALIIGVCLLYLGKRTASVAKAVEQINYLVQFLMKFIAKQVPVVTFLVVLKMILSGTFSILSNSWKLLLIVAPVELIVLIIIAIVCGLILKLNPLKLIKKSIPLFLLIITTASSAAGFDTNMHITKDEMGVDGALAAFGVPLATVICRVGTSVYYPLLCFHFFNLYNIEVSWSLLASVVIASVFIGVATPPIPGGGAAAFMALFTQVGIPTDAVATALALDVIMDFIMSTGCYSPIPMMLAVLAKSTGRLDEKILNN